MFKWIKKYLISHSSNDYEPHILREAGATFLLVVIIATFVLGVSSHYVFTKTKLTSLVLSSVLVDYTNNDRFEKNYSHLTINPVLVKAAQLKANDMAEKGYFAHTSPEGKSPWYWFRQAGYDFNYAGENLAVNFSESSEVNTAWMNSPGHRANILNDKFSEIGVATAQGMYQGKTTTFVVQLFGAPKLPSVATATHIEKTKVDGGVAQAKSGMQEPKVLSESISSSDVAVKEGNDLFVAVENTDNTAPIKNGSKPEYSNVFERIASSPKKILSITYIFISVLILFSLVSFVFVEIKRHHIKMIITAIALICLMIGLLYVYKNVIITPLLIV